MVWHFEAISGPVKGLKLEVAVGDTFGRSGATHVIQDTKVSSIHAKVISGPNKALFLIHNSSTNGLYVGEVRVSSIKITEGLEFRIGRSLFKVLPHQPIVNKIEDASAPALVKTLSWDEHLSSLAKVSAENIVSVSRPILPFLNPLELHVLRGSQVETIFQIGFGPRKVGRASPDIFLHTPDGPDICFVLTPQEQDCLYETQYPERVLVNERSAAKHILREGDRISIDNILIEVHFPEK